MANFATLRDELETLRAEVEAMKADDEEILATIPASSPRAYSTGYALLAPGTAASFKIYAITTEGNERGSNPVTVTRPF